jgi:hypothetical protein
MIWLADSYVNVHVYSAMTLTWQAEARDMRLLPAIGALRVCISEIMANLGIVYF